MNTIRRLPVLLAAGALCAAATAAHADSRAWTAAKKALPSGLQVVVGMSFDSIRSSDTFKALWPVLMAQAGDAQTKLDALKANCKIDFVNVLDSAVVGMDAKEKGAVVLALKGTTEKELDACIVLAAKADGKSAKIDKEGVLTKYSGVGPKDVYIKWLDASTLAMATDTEDKALLGKMMTGGIATDKALKAALAKSKTDAALWAVVNKQQDLDPVKAKMTMGYGNADIKAGTIAADLHLVVDSAKGAADAAKQANDQLAAVKSGGGLPPMIANALAGLTIKADGSEVVLGASVKEADLMTLMQMAMGGMGGAAAPASATPPPSKGGTKPLGTKKP